MGKRLPKEFSEYLKKLDSFGDIKFNADRGALRQSVTDVEQSLKHLPIIAGITGGIVVGAVYLLATRKKAEHEKTWVERIGAEDSTPSKDARAR